MYCTVLPLFFAASGITVDMQSFCIVHIKSALMATNKVNSAYQVVDMSTYRRVSTVLEAFLLIWLENLMTQSIGLID